MKVLFTDYTFNPISKQIVFNTTDQLSIHNILLVTNVTDNVTIYLFNNNNLGGVISNNILTLNYDTTSMSPTDDLQIFVDIGGSPSSEATLEQLVEQTMLLKRLAKILESNTVVDSAQRQRVTIDAGTLPAVTTVSAVTNLVGAGGVSPLEHILIMSRNLYANEIRSKLTFS